MRGVLFQTNKWTTATKQVETRLRNTSQGQPLASSRTFIASKHPAPPTPCVFACLCVWRLLLFKQCWGTTNDFWCSQVIIVFAFLWNISDVFLKKSIICREKSILHINFDYISNVNDADNLEDYSVLAHGAGPSVPTGMEGRFKIFNTPLKPFPYLATSRVPCALARLTADRVSASASTKCEEMTELVFGFTLRGKGFLHWHSPRADCRVELT